MKLNEEYFSGSQASVFIGDIWVDEITDLQYSVAANATPIYGYGATFFSHVAQGRVLVQGNFTINFREPNYLFMVLERYKSRLPNFNKNSTETTELDSYRVNELTDRFGDPRGQLVTSIPSYENARTNLDNFFNENPANRKGMESRVLDSKLNNIEGYLVNDFAIPLFDIKIGYGAILDEDSVGQQIVGVKLVGRGKVIMANGEPIKESYSFFAQNLV